MAGLFSDFFRIDSLNHLFAATGLVVTFLSILSIRANIEQRRLEYFLTNIVYIISFLVVIYSRNWLVFFIGWEMVTVSTTLMLLWRSRGLAGQYFIVQFLGSSILLYVVLVAQKAGYSEIILIKEIWLQNLLILGLGMKSALFGFHFWLPPIHSQAPAPVSAILSGWVVKLGLITMLKLIPGGNSLLLILGVLMIFYGGIRALRSSNYKVLLANSSISQLGYIAIGIGSGTVYGHLGSILYIIAHGLAKTGLFVGSGYLIRETGSRSIYQFREIWKKQRLLSVSILAGFSSLIGIPLFIGYNAKYLVKYGLKGELFFTILLYAAGLLTWLYGLRFLYWGIFKDLLEKKRNMDSLKQNYSLDRADRLLLSIVVVLLLMGGLSSGVLTSLISEKVFEYHLIEGLMENIIYVFISVLLLKKAGWYKTKDNEVPSLDSLFNRINKGLYNLGRNLYNWIYQDFQYQLLWLPLFLLILFLWVNFISG